MKTPLFIVVLFAAVLAAGQWMVGQRQAVPRAPVGGNVYHVAYVNDGDTIKLNDGQHVRLIGIDTPETHNNKKLAKDAARRKISRKMQLAMGEQAAVFVRSFLSDKDVRLEFDVQAKDHYGRTLAYVYLMDGTFVNEKIIREGYAYPLTIPPNVRYAHQFKQWFDEARENKRGLWK